MRIDHRQISFSEQLYAIYKIYEINYSSKQYQKYLFICTHTLITSEFSALIQKNLDFIFTFDSY